jgi:hypothetical protein
MPVVPSCLLLKRKRNAAAPAPVEPLEEPAAESAAEEHIPTIEETIELPKDVAPEKSSEAADEILAAVENKADEEKQETTGAADGAEEALPAQKKADVVFAQENEVIPSIITDKEKALTGEDHSGRNLLNIVVFGGIALIILLVLLIKM